MDLETFSFNEMFHLSLSGSFIHSKSPTRLTFVASKPVFLVKVTTNLLKI